jgi:NADH:ubiquinone oxidoreductase subunit 3 (subunit A)
LLVAGMLAWWAVFGFWDTLFDPAEPLGLSFDGRSHLTMAVLVAFVATGSARLRSGTLRDIRSLGALAAVPSAAVEEALRRNAGAPLWVRVVALAVAFLLGVVILPLTGGPGLRSLAGWNLHHVWAVANNTAIFFLMLEGAWLTIEGWRTTARLMGKQLRFDLLDRAALASIGRSGLRGAALWLGGCTIGSLLTWGVSELAPLLIILSVALALATASLVLPALLARGSLRRAKHTELQRVRATIAEARDAVLSGRGDERSEQATLLPGLLAYEARIESVREWPYDTPTLVRFGLLAAIAVSSWLGGALVERALGALLD